MSHVIDFGASRHGTAPGCPIYCHGEQIEKSQFDYVTLRVIVCAQYSPHAVATGSNLFERRNLSSRTGVTRDVLYGHACH